MYYNKARYAFLQEEFSMKIPDKSAYFCLL